MESGYLLASARVFLILLGLLLIYLGWKGVLEPMVMIPMGLGMIAINCGTLFMPDGTLGNLFLDPMLSDTDALMNTMQIDFLQPVYTLTFSNGLIACFVFMGIGTLLDVEQLLNSTAKGRHRISMVRDVRIFVNTIDHAIRLMTDNGVPATAHREEKDGYIEYTVRIPTAAAEK